MPVSVRLTRSIQKAKHHVSHFYLLFLFLRCNILPSNSQRSKLVNWTSFNKRSISELSKMLASAEAEIGEGVYWKVQKKREGEKKVKLHHSALTLEGPALIILPRRSPCTRAGCLVVLGLPPPAFITSWLHWDLHPTTRGPPPSVRLLRLLLVWERRRFWLSEPGNPLLALSPRLAHRLWKTCVWKYERINFFFFWCWAVGVGEWWRKRRVKRIVAPTESKVNSVVYVGNLRMYLDTSVPARWPAARGVFFFTEQRRALRLLVQWIHYWKQLPAACSENCSRLFLA